VTKRLFPGSKKSFLNNPAASEPGSRGDYVWSPDGTKIAFTSAPLSGLPEAFVMDADGSNVGGHLALSSA
jgi:Tol biopolymer transport system component